MRLILKNFKCWQNKIIDINTKGVHLISGESGKGKSSILDGIYFCLYGELKKIVKYGSKSCEVSLEYENKNKHFKITRTRTPNRLIMYVDDDIYEDDVAQDYIEKIFGNHFAYTSYVQQNINKTFLYMSPSEKLEFLEECVLGRYNIENMKNTIKNHIRELEKEVDNLNGQYKTYSEIISNKTKPHPIEFPIKCHPKNIPVIIKNENTYVKNSSIMIKKYTAKIEAVKKINTSIDILSEKYGDKKNKIVELNHKLNVYNKKLNDIPKFDPSKKTQLEQELNRIDVYREYSELEKLLEEETAIYEKQLNDEIEKTKNQIQEVDETRIPIIENKIKLLNLDLSNRNKYIFLQKQLSQMTKPTAFYDDDYIGKLQNQIINMERVIKTYRKTLSCPHCCKRVIIKDDYLEKFEVDYDCSDLENILQDKKNELKNIKKSNMEWDKYNKIENEIIGLNHIEYDIEESLKRLQDEYKKTIEIISENKRLNKLLKTKSFPSLKRSVDIIRSLNKKLEKFDEIEIPDETANRDDIVKEISDMNSNHKIYIEYQNQIVELEESIHTTKNEVEEIDKKIICYKTKTEDLGGLEELLLEQQNIFEKSSKNVELIEKYEAYQTELLQYNELVDKIKSIEVRMGDKNNELLNTELLKTKILQAESLSITHFIETINIHTQIYLDHFFKNEQIFINISTEKETKKHKKTQINLNIEYKGYVVDITNLSGGERDRVNLAFTLALSEIFQSPILLLDECIASLDYENCSNVLQTIREHYKGEYVVCVHHQANEGLFDSVINIY